MFFSNALFLTWDQAQAWKRCSRAESTSRHKSMAQSLGWFIINGLAAASLGPWRQDEGRHEWGVSTEGLLTTWRWPLNPRTLTMNHFAACFECVTSHKLFHVHWTVGLQVSICKSSWPLTNATNRQIYTVIYSLGILGNWGHRKLKLPVLLIKMQFSLLFNDIFSFIS